MSTLYLFCVILGGGGTLSVNFTVYTDGTEKATKNEKTSQQVYDTCKKVSARWGVAF